LINDVLDLSKVEAGKLEFRPEPVDLAILVDDVMGTMRPAADARHIQTTVAVEPDARDAVLDAARLKQILYNYISNAIKFTPEGGRIAVRVRAGADDIVRLEVEDTGIGIAAGDQHRLFVEFQQLDHGAAKQHGGTGLGLALTKRLVERQGGRVGVESEPGTGSLFFAELPRRQAAAPFRTLTTAQGSPDSGPTILVIEDDAADRRQLIEILSAAGYHVLAVERGTDALELCATHRVDAVTLDLLLPDQSGLDLLQQIRRHSANPDVPVVVVTVITESHVMAGHVVADVLQKPITGEALLGSLRRAGVAAPGGERVLVVDDDESARRLAAVTLEQAGYRVEVHADPRRGLQAARARPPAAIVLDLLMPDIDGFQFLHQLRDDEATRATPVIVWTVKDLSPEEADRLAGMVRRVVQKGMSAGELLRELEAVLPPVRREPA
jgi:DNA-binding response OmpR family regulator